MTPNKPTTLREEFLKMAIKHHPSSNEYFINASPDEIANWWLDKLTSHNTELLQKIKGIVREETPSHITREYRDTDSMRDRICKRINLINNHK